MRQVVLKPRDGSVDVLDVPEPALRPGHVLVATAVSLISAGTERGRVELARKSLLAKARARPDLVRKVVDRARAEGPRAALGAAFDRLDTLAPLGYSSAGTVVEIGQGVEGLAPGDRVACAGGGYASHAERVVVPGNLVAKIPEGVSFEAASYATVGAIALHGVRRAEAEVGERIAVIGLGLVGQLAVQLLDAAGCVPTGIDPDEAARTLADCVTYAPDDPALAANGFEADAVIVCAASSSAEPVELAAQLARDRGRIVVVGDTVVAADRAVLYEKELELRLSRSYGPGRYDVDYEERGRDLPAGYVRWTEGRNLDAFLDLAARGRIDPARLTTHRFDVEHAADAYALLESPPPGERPFGIVLGYPETAAAAPRPPAARTRTATPRVGLIGAGAFARSTLLPALRAEGATLAAVASASGLTAADVAQRYDFERACSVDDVLADDSIDAVVIATRHSSHAALAARALRAGKHVLVEKPLALTSEQLADVEDALTIGGTLMVGFNRRFAPHVDRVLDELRGIGGRTVAVRVNAGPLPPDHWLLDPEEGGGRILGEGCHFVDLLATLAGAPIVSVAAHGTADETTATVRFGDGGIGSLVYTGTGDARLPKERVEVFAGGVAAVLDDFRRLELWRGGRRSVTKGKQDKGHRAEIACFLAVAAGTAEPPTGYVASMRATLAVLDSVRTGRTVECAASAAP